MGDRIYITALETETEKESTHLLISAQPVHPPDTTPWQERERLCLFLWELTLGIHPLGLTLLAGRKEFELTQILPREPSITVKRLCKLSKCPNKI